MEVFLKQILPFGIDATDQIHLFLSRTCFDLLLSKNGGIHIVAAFEIYQFINIVLLRKGTASTRPVLQRAAL